MSFASYLYCQDCGWTGSLDEIVNLCPVDGRPLRVALDLDRLTALRGRDGWWRPERRSLWRFGGLLPLDWDDPGDRAWIVSQGEGATPLMRYAHPLAEALEIILELKDEGRPYADQGANPTGSFKDRGVAMAVSMARRLGIRRLAMPTQGNAGDSLAFYAMRAGLECVIVMPRETDLPILGAVAARAVLEPIRVMLEVVDGTIVDCGRRVRERYVPAGYFSVATFQEPGWRIEGKKTLGLEMAQPWGERLAARKWELPQVIVYPTGGGTGVLGMAKAFDELEALGLVDDRRPRMVCVQSDQTCPLARAMDAGALEPDFQSPGRTIATGLNVASNVGHGQVLKVVRGSGGCVVRVTDRQIRDTIREEWRARRYAWSPEGAATLAALPELADRGQIEAGDRVVLVNTAAAFKYLPSIVDELDGGL